jgi:arylsulfatase A-like enzyme
MSEQELIIKGTRVNSITAVLIGIAVLTGALLMYLLVSPNTSPPNILWIVWDTTRSDHLSLYGYKKQTTPFLDKWAQGGRVFSNCTSIANSTVPSHASMFTGLLPSEHLMNNTDNYMGDKFTTVAEQLRENDYQTYMFSANPFISKSRNITQGFDVVEHPWNDKFLHEAYSIVKRKIKPEDVSSDLSDRVRQQKLIQWSFKACGELAKKAVEAWLTKNIPNKPFFIFLNYMEAHHPLIPEESYRQQMMNREQVKKSYMIDRSLSQIWNYTFGIKEYSKEEIEITNLTYDAAVAELDDLLKDLIVSLEAGGYLDNTVVILTSDHGEHLGEQHMLDHQYSVYESLIRIPLVIYFPDRFLNGFDDRPVTNLDIYSTVLELAGIEMTSILNGNSLSLLHPKDERVRIAECPAFMTHWFDETERVYPDFDSTPWRRTLRVVYKGTHKYIWASDGRHEMYNLAVDRGEHKNLIQIERELAQKLAEMHHEWVMNFQIHEDKKEQNRLMTEEEKQRLESLGYVGGKQK